MPFSEQKYQIEVVLCSNIPISFAVSSFVNLFSYSQCMEASSKILQAYRVVQTASELPLNMFPKKIKQKDPFILDDSEK